MLITNPKFCALVDSIDDLMSEGLTPFNKLNTSYLLLYACGKLSASEMRAYIAGASQGDTTRLALFQKVLRSMEGLEE